MVDGPAKRTPPRWGKLVFALLGIGLFVWVLVAKDGAKIVADVVERLGYRWPLLLVPFAANAIITGLAYRSALPGRGRAVPWRVLIHAERSGAVLTSLLPLGNAGGNIAKLVLLRHWFLSEELVAAGAWGAIATGLCHALAAVGPLFAIAADAAPIPAAALVLAAGNVVMSMPALLVLSSVRHGLSQRVARLLALVPARLFGKRRERISAWANRLDRHLAAAVGERRGDFAVQIAYKAAAQAVRIAEIWLAVELIGLPGGLATAVLYNSLSRTMTLLWSFVPGQLGVLEMSSMVGFASLGFAPEMGLSLALVLRFRYVVNMALSATALGTSAKLLREYPTLPDREILARRNASA